MHKAIALPFWKHATLSLNAKRWLQGAIKSWIATILFGQWMFALYILAQFTKPWLAGSLDESQFSHMIKGYVNGDSVYNTMLLLHILPVAVISLSATLQLIPSFRIRFPTFHRLNGRVFLFLGFAGALTGLYLTWVQGTRLSDIGALGITLNGLLIPVAVYYAWRFAVQKNFAQHRRFAIHAFILINGVWTLRLYLMGWFMINQGQWGNNATMDGPADLVLSYACYLLPMGIAEVVFWAERQRARIPTLIAAGCVSLATFITFIGVAAATMMMWMPRISAAI